MIRTSLGLVFLLALAVSVFTLVVIPHSVQAGGEGSVMISPVSATVGEGGTTTVYVVVTAPSASLRGWGIEIGYDPSVIQVDQAFGNTVCTAPAVPGTTDHQEGCSADDLLYGDGVDDTAYTYGYWTNRVGGEWTGWVGTNTVASFTFRATGSAGQYSPLSLIVDSFNDASLVMHSPSLTFGGVTVVASYSTPTPSPPPPTSTPSLPSPTPTPSPYPPTQTPSPPRSTPVLKPSITYTAEPNSSRPTATNTTANASPTPISGPASATVTPSPIPSSLVGDVDIADQPGAALPEADSGSSLNWLAVSILGAAMVAGLGVAGFALLRVKR